MDCLEQQKNREEISSEFKWRLEDIYASDTEWESELRETRDTLPALKDLRTTLDSSAEAMAKGLESIDDVAHKVERLYVYARMRRDENNANPTYQAMTDRAEHLSVSFSNEVSFVNPLVLGMDEKTLRKYISHPSLKNYSFFLNDLLRNKAHVLSESQELLLSMVGEFSGGSQEIFTMLNNADLKFESVEHNGETIPLSHATYISLMQNPDRELRRKVYTTYYTSFKDHINTIAAAYSTNVKKNVFYSKARKHENPLSKALFGDDVPTSIYDELIGAVHSHLPTMYKYIDLRKKILGLDNLSMYDIYVPLVKDVDNKFSYERAVEMNLQALAPLGEEYLSVLKDAFEKSWVDVYPNKGKTSGAYSWGVYGVHPYVLLNYRGDLDSVFTIAHEMGHAMHTYFSNKHQPYPTSGYTIFVAEVASTVNELLMTKYLLKTEPSLKKYVLNHYIDQFRTTVVRQTMFAEFEKITHDAALKGEPLTSEWLSDTYGRLNHQYYGDSIEKDDTIPFEWARIPHFYNAFYVYKYATGLSCAVEIVNNLQKPGMCERYLEFLSGGGSDYPLNLLEKAGVNVPNAVDVCMDEFARAVDEFSRY